MMKRTKTLFLRLHNNRNKIKIIFSFLTIQEQLYLLKINKLFFNLIKAHLHLPFKSTQLIKEIKTYETRVNQLSFLQCRYNEYIISNEISPIEDEYILSSLFKLNTNHGFIVTSLQKESELNFFSKIINYSIHYPSITSIEFDHVKVNDNIIDNTIMENIFNKNCLVNIQSLSYHQRAGKISLLDFLLKNCFVLNNLNKLYIIGNNPYIDNFSLNEQIEKMSNLQTLYLDKVRVTSSLIDYIKKLMNKRLLNLNFTQCDITVKKEEMISFIECIGKKRVMNKIVLLNNKIEYVEQVLSNIIDLYFEPKSKIHLLLLSDTSKPFVEQLSPFEIQNNTNFNTSLKCFPKKEIMIKNHLDSYSVKKAHFTLRLTVQKLESVHLYSKLFITKLSLIDLNAIYSDFNRMISRILLEMRPAMNNVTILKYEYYNSIYLKESNTRYHFDSVVSFSLTGSLFFEANSYKGLLYDFLVLFPNMRTLIFKKTCFNEKRALKYILGDNFESNDLFKNNSLKLNTIIFDQSYYHTQDDDIDIEEKDIKWIADTINQFLNTFESPKRINFIIKK